MSDFLIIRFSSLGDVVMTTAVVEELSQELPDANIYLLTKKAYEGVFHEDVRIKKVIAISGKESPQKIARMTGLDFFDGVIDLHSNLRSRAVSTFIKSPKKVRVNKHPIARRLMVWTKNKFQRNFDVLESYLQTLNQFGIGGVRMPKITPSENILKAAAALLHAYHPGSETNAVGLAPGAKHQAKRWNVESFARVADSIAERGSLPVFIGDKNDEPIVRKIQTLMKNESLTLAGKIDLTLTIGVIALLEGFVTNDSGPMHIAGALETPFVAVFGPTHHNLGFVPGYPTGSVLHTGVPCSPCSIHGEKSCWMESRFCMNGITWEMVNDELGKVIG
ncbi:glycosyltransferase family 9 protein [Candidatus Latescibacterota bacterium]